MKHYRVSERKLVNLLKDSNILGALYRDGVDDWSWYGEGFGEWIEEAGLDPRVHGFYDLAQKELEGYEECE